MANVKRKRRKTNRGALLSIELFYPCGDVFFGTRDTNNFKRAFTEYAVGIQNKVQPEQANITVQQLNEAVPIADEANRQLNKDKVREKAKHESL